jgi:hypothetical protein
MKKEKEKENARNAKLNATDAKNASASVRQPHVAVSTLSTTPAFDATLMANTSATSLPNAIIPQPGFWTRFWLFMCCTSAQYTNNRH